MDYKINFNKPFIIGNELENIKQAITENNKLSGDGKFTRLCQNWLEQTLNCKKALLTHSCTAALEMSAILAGLGPGDEVIMPSFTFPSTANAVVLRNALPVFVDIRPDTLNIDENKIEEAITEKTKAIIPVHYAGLPCEMDKIMKIAGKYNLVVIEDAAQAILSDYKGKRPGSIGHFGCLSFHETKNIITGEGGALLINDEKYIKRAEIIWEKGTNRKQFFRGEVDKYTWVDVGSSFLPGELTAAFLWPQLLSAKKIIENRLMRYNLYYDLLKELAQNGTIALPPEKDHITANGHIFYLITKNPQEREQLLRHLNDNGVKAIFHYIPLHNSPAGKKFGRSYDNLPNTENLSRRIVRLPIYYNLEEEKIQYICGHIHEFYAN